MRSIKLENHFTHSQSVQLLNMCKREMERLTHVQWNKEKNGEDTTDIKKQINDLRHTQITMDIWKAETHIW